MTHASHSLKMLALRGGHFGGPRGVTETVLVLIGLAFAGFIVWTIEHNRRTTSR